MIQVELNGFKIYTKNLFNKNQNWCLVEYRLTAYW